MADDEDTRYSQGNKRSKSGDEMEEEMTSSNKSSKSEASNPSSAIDVDRDGSINNNNEEFDEDFVNIEMFRKEDIQGTLLVFDALSYLITVDSIGAIIKKLGFQMVAVPSINEASRVGYVRVVGEEVYEDFKAKYKGEVGKLAPRRRIGTDTVYANIALTKKLDHFERVKEKLGTQFAEEIVRTLKRREKEAYVDIPEIFIEILSFRSAIIHFNSPTDIFKLLRRIDAADFFFVNDCSLRIIKSLIKSTNDLLMKVLATVKPPRGSKKFLEAKEPMMDLITKKILANKTYKVKKGPWIWTQIYKKDGHATNMAIGFIDKGFAPEFIAAVKAIYTDNPAKLSGFILEVVEHRDNYYTRA